MYDGRNLRSGGLIEAVVVFVEVERLHSHIVTAT